MKQSTLTEQEIKELKAEAAELRKVLKNKSLSQYTRNKSEKRIQEIFDLLCGFDAEEPTEQEIAMKTDMSTIGLAFVDACNEWREQNHRETIPAKAFMEVANNAVKKIRDLQGKPVSDNSEGVKGCKVAEYEGMGAKVIELQYNGFNYEGTTIATINPDLTNGRQVADEIAEAVNNYQSLKQEVNKLQNGFIEATSENRELWKVICSVSGYGLNNGLDQHKKGIEQSKQENERLKDINRELVAMLENAKEDISDWTLEYKPNLYPTKITIEIEKIIEKAKSLNL